jgi:hypothetical protein
MPASSAPDIFSNPYIPCHAACAGTRDNVKLQILRVIISQEKFGAWIAEDRARDDGPY